ncbi:hypothetical protein Tco_1164535 [Tanacetum coccineum]
MNKIVNFDDDNDDVEKDDKDDDADDEGDDHVSDTQDVDDEDVKTESDEDEIYKYKIRVRNEEDVEMKDAEVEESDKGEEKVTDAAKEEAEKTSEAKDDTKKSELPPSSSSLFVSSGFGDQFLKVSSDSSLFSTVKDSVDANRQPISTTVHSPQVTPIFSSVQQTPTPIPTPPITTDALTVTTAVPESNVLTTVELRVVKLEKDVSELKTIDLSSKALAVLQSQVPIHADDKDEDDEDPPAKLNQGKKTKRRRTKESKSSKKLSTTKETPKGKAPTKGSKTGKSDSAKELVEEPIAEVVIDDDADDVARDVNQPQDTSEPKTRKTLNPEWFKQPPRPPTHDPEWNKRQNNPEGDCYPFDLSKPLPLQGPLGHRTVAADYFFNNDLEYLKTSDPEVTYTTSITKTKAARYEIKGIEDMVPTLWSTIKHAYDKDAEKGIKHWGERRKLWYRSQISKFSKQNVYSTKAILGVKSVSVKKLHGYGHFEEIVVKRSDQQLYKFKEGDFVDLHLNDIEDMLLLVVQHKLFHLDDNVIVDFIVALRMFTRSLILKRRVKDLQLRVESYQKKLNITKPQKTFPEIEFKEPYTPSYDPPGIVYEDLDKQKRVLRANELYKFSDGTLKSIRDEIHHRVLDFLLDYNTEMPIRK